MSTAQEMDREGFTAAERAYFESGGKVTDGLLNNEPDDIEQPAPESTPEPAAAASPEPAPQPDSNVDPFDDLEKIVKDNRARTHKLIPEQNFRVVSEKYKTTKKERDELKSRLEALEGSSKSWQDELAKEREMRARIDERLKLFNEVISPVEQPAARAAPPNPEEDIFGYLKWQAEENERKYNELMERVGQTSQTIQSQNEESELRSAYQQDAVRFARSTPDFAEAYNQLNKVRDAMLENAGYADPKVRQQIRLDEERSLVAQTLKSGKSPAEVIYNIAKTLGYQTPAPATAPAPAPVTQQPSVTAEIERIQKAQAASKTLSGAGGAGPAPMTVQALAEMKDEEFERFARKNPALVKQLMGGI